MTINGTATPCETTQDMPDVELDALESGGVEKGPHAFRTISEVADELHVPQHTLRLWETQFHQVRPLKRGGGRRYYRPDDVALLSQIADLLYNQGYTAKGVQRLLREGLVVAEEPPQSEPGTTVEDISLAVSANMVAEPDVEGPVVTDYQQIEAVAAELPAAVEAGLEEALVQVLGQNVRLRADLADVLVELEAIRRKILA